MKANFMPYGIYTKIDELLNLVLRERVTRLADPLVEVSIYCI